MAVPVEIGWMEAYKRGAHTVWDCKYHLVWVTKYRYSVLGGDVGVPCRGAGARSFIDGRSLPRLRSRRKQRRPRRSGGERRAK